MNCTFFGHRDAPYVLKSKVKKTILELKSNDIELFYVGNNGNFDLLVQEVLEELGVEYQIVLSRINEEAISGNQENTFFPEGLEFALPKFAISKRNEWLLKNSSIVISYCKNSYSNVYKWLEKARKIGLDIISL